MKIGLLLQARTGSTRLPGKIFMDLNGRYSIQRILDGCKKTVYPHKILLCMPKEDEAEIKERISNGELESHIDERFDLFIGGENSNDLVDRFYKAARLHNIDVIVRLTCDNPMYEAAEDIIDDMIDDYLDNGAMGFLGNNDAISRNPFPNGIDVEIFNYRMLCWAKANIKDKINLEHCATSFYKCGNPFSVRAYNNMNRISKLIPSFTLDTVEDYQLLLKLTKNYDACQDLNAAIEKTNYEVWNNDGK